MLSAMSGDTRRPRLLLAEDNPSVAAALVRLLSVDFDVVCVVSDGGALIERTQQFLPDVVVTDVMLDELDGLSATRAIRRRDLSLPIVVITGHVDPAMRHAALAAGASAFLAKMEVGHSLVGLLQSLLP